jgi:hypothetical protein
MGWRACGGPDQDAEQRRGADNAVLRGREAKLIAEGLLSRLNARGNRPPSLPLRG